MERSPRQIEERFQQVVEEKEGKVIGNYFNTKIKVLIECKEGHKWEATPQHIRGGTWCKKCANVCPEQAEEKFWNLVQEKGGKILGLYVNADTKVLVECEDGHPWEIRPQKLISKGQWCRKCSGLCPIEAEERFRISRALYYLWNGQYGLPKLYH